MKDMDYAANLVLKINIVKIQKLWHVVNLQVKKTQVPNMNLF